MSAKRRVLSAKIKQELRELYAFARASAPQWFRTSACTVISLNLVLLTLALLNVAWFHRNANTEREALDLEIAFASSVEMRNRDLALRDPLDEREVTPDELEEQEPEIAEEVVESAEEPTPDPGSTDDKEVSEATAGTDIVIAGPSAGEETDAQGLGNPGDGMSGVSHEFGSQVAGIRKNGLDVVFLFDSTGSMGSYLLEAKQKIQFLSDMINVIVPDNARIGVGTYRDVNEDYVVMGRELTRDFKRIQTFVKSIKAGGGGDEPEAVAEAVLWAMNDNPWREDAQKVIVLIGDAWPHFNGEYRDMMLAIPKFVKNNGTINSIVTYSQNKVRQEASAGRAYDEFTKITDKGNGSTLTFEQQDQMAKKLLLLTFGAEFAADIDAIYTEALNRLSGGQSMDGILSRADAPAPDAVVKKEKSQEELVQEWRACLYDDNAASGKLCKAIRELAKYYDEADAKRVYTLADHEDNTVRYYAVKSLNGSKFRDNRALIAVIEKRLDANDMFVPYYVSALEECGVESTAVLIRILSFERVNAKAAAALKNLHGQDFGLNAARWRAWWDERK